MIPKHFFGHFHTDVILIVSDILFNTVPSPVLKLKGDSQSRREFNILFFRGRLSCLRENRTIEEAILLVNCLKCLNLRYYFHPTEFVCKYGLFVQNLRNILSAVSFSYYEGDCRPSSFSVQELQTRSYHLKIIQVYL